MHIKVSAANKYLEKVIALSALSSAYDHGEITPLAIFNVQCHGLVFKNEHTALAFAS